VCISVDCDVRFRVLLMVSLWLGFCGKGWLCWCKVVSVE